MIQSVDADGEPIGYQSLNTEDQRLYDGKEEDDDDGLLSKLVLEQPEAVEFDDDFVILNDSYFPGRRRRLLSSAASSSEMQLAPLRRAATYDGSCNNYKSGFCPSSPDTVQPVTPEKALELLGPLLNSFNHGSTGSGSSNPSKPADVFQIDDASIAANRRDITQQRPLTYSGPHESPVTPQRSQIPMAPNESPCNPWLRQPQFVEESPLSVASEERTQPQRKRSIESNKDALAENELHTNEEATLSGPLFGAKAMKECHPYIQWLFVCWGVFT